MKIFKYPLYCLSAPEMVELPKGAKVISANVQHSNIVFWALVEESSVRERRTFLLAMTGQEIDHKVIEVFNTFTVEETGLVFTFMEINDRLKN